MLRSLFPIDVDQQFDLKITIQLHDPHLEWIEREECAVDEDVVKPMVSNINIWWQKTTQLYSEYILNIHIHIRYIQYKHKYILLLYVKYVNIFVQYGLYL